MWLESDTSKNSYMTRYNKAKKPKKYTVSIPSTQAVLIGKVLTN
jgi:hypothetical protein